MSTCLYQWIFVIWHFRLNSNYFKWTTHILSKKQENAWCPGAEAQFLENNNTKMPKETLGKAIYFHMFLYLFPCCQASKHKFRAFAWCLVIVPIFTQRGVLKVDILWEEWVGRALGSVVFDLTNFVHYVLLRGFFLYDFGPSPNYHIGWRDGTLELSELYSNINWLKQSKWRKAIPIYCFIYGLSLTLESELFWP